MPKKRSADLKEKSLPMTGNSGIDEKYPPGKKGTISGPGEKKAHWQQTLAKRPSTLRE